jgi:hypothetical protein
MVFGTISAWSRGAMAVSLLFFFNTFLLFFFLEIFRKLIFSAFVLGGDGTVYAKVANYISWIKQEIASH